MTVRITHTSGPTTLINVSEWRLLTDPTFDLLAMGDHSLETSAKPPIQVTATPAATAHRSAALSSAR
jgi:hypothetical protein